MVSAMLKDSYRMPAVSVLLAVRPSWRVKGLRAVLRTIPGIGVIRQAHDTAVLLERMVESRADLVLLDTSITGDQVSAIVSQIKTLSHPPLCIFIAQRRDQEYEALRAGADAVLLDGFGTELLAETIQRLSVPESVERHAVARGISAQTTRSSDARAFGRRETPNPDGAGLLRILVADDSGGLAWSTAAILRGAGYEVDVALSGEEAWRKLCGGQFECLLSDIRMDPLDGIELCHKVKARFPALPVILMTAHDDLVVPGNRAGALEVLRKPLDLARLLHLMRSLTPIAGQAGS